MALNNLVEEAKKNTPKRKAPSANGEVKNLIDCSGARPEIIRPSVSWEECKYLKNGFGEYYCQAYLSKCGKTGCKKAVK